MKKVFAILLVLALVAGFVFAESHELRVKADVTEVLPAFNLYHVEGTDTNSTTTNVYGTNASYATLKADNAATDVNFNLDEANKSFSVTAEVINNVKTTKKFKIEFTGGVFSVKRNTVGGTYSPKQITVAYGSANDAIKEFTGKSDSDTNATVTADTTETLTATSYVTFSGKTGTGATTPITVATATYTYAGDDSIDPTASGVYYYADVKMTVTVQ